MLDKGYEAVGNAQTADVQRVFSRLRSSIPLYETPGNHDVDDVPTIATMRRYKALWGTQSAQGFSFEREGHLFLVLNSMLYFNGSATDGAAAAQTRWLRRELDRAQGRASLRGGVFVLTHICPFVGSPGEPHGWANWPLAARRELLEMTTASAGSKAVQLWVCGHLHSNAVVHSEFEGAPIEIVISSAVGSRMQWDGQAVNDYAPSRAAAIATKSMGEAFFDHMLRGTDGKANQSQLAVRIRASPNWSGVRVVELAADGGYRHKWFTLSELAKHEELGDIAMVGAQWRRRRSRAR